MPALVSLADVEPEPHARLFEDAPKTLRLSLSAGETIPEHEHPGRDVVFVLYRGRVTLTLDGEDYEVQAGDVARFSGDQEISPTAETDATAVLVFTDAD